VKKLLLLFFNLYTSCITSIFAWTWTLFGKYTNPFNISTKIKFDLPIRGGVETQYLASLKIFDINGHEIATLVNETLQPGTYEVEWNAENFSSGIYLYQLKSENFIKTKKMLFVK
jgi:hypothetical protein